MKKIFSILLCLVLSHISLYGMSNFSYEIDKQNPSKVVCNNRNYTISDMIGLDQINIVHHMLKEKANPNLEVSIAYHKGNLLSLAIYHGNIKMINLLISYCAIPPQDDLKSFYALLEKSSEQIQDIIIKRFQKDFPKPITYHVTTVVSPEESIDNTGVADSSKPRYFDQKPQTLLQKAIPHSSGVHSPLFQAAWDNNCNQLHKLLRFSTANINNVEGNHSLLEIAILTKKLEMVKILLEFNIRIPTSVLFPKFLFEQGTPEIRDLILPHYTIPANEFYNVVNIPFHISHAVKMNLLQTVSDLLKNGANPNAQDDNRDSLLFLAVKADNKPMARLLVQYEEARVGFNNIDWVKDNASQEMLDIIYPPTARIDDQPLPLVEESATDSINLKTTDSSKNKIVSWLSDNKKTSILTVGISIVALWAFGKYKAKQKQSIIKRTIYE